MSWELPQGLIKARSHSGAILMIGKPHYVVYLALKSRGWGLPMVCGQEMEYNPK
jgi:hypothetical protein